MLLIRRFEERLLELFSLGELFGTTHTSIGQEAIAVGVLNHLNDNDIVISNHRCHGHYLASTGDVTGLLAELMGKNDGVCKGRGGSQHLHVHNFYSNGVLGNMFPVAAGMAYAEKVKDSKAILVIFIGDGTFGEGVMYETLNLISLWKVPMLIVVENNRYAQSTKIEDTLAGSIKDRVTAFDIETTELSTFDVSEIYTTSKVVVQKTRNEKKPKCLILNTYRFASHSKSDDGRSKKEVEEWLVKDPLQLIEKEFDKRQLEKEKKLIINELEKVVRKAIDAPFA